MVDGIVFNLVFLGCAVTTLLAWKHCRPQKVRLRPARRRQDW
jgi:hypothetical protein